MHVILLTSLCGEKRGNVGDKLPVASQEEADELVRIGIARYDTEAELKRQLAEYQAREQQQAQAAALAEEQARAAEESAKAGATEEEPKGKQVKAKTDKA
ncbi:MAG: hypothetical protein KAX58_02995 [Aeromonadaceae bacterium]|jgi:hypothetical protein|uniref:hypothetical protein n=1 Tax=Aeromonas TaxID=642 RepID=UPI001B45E914|nr:hypothetical protein [Aeromonas caviae]MBP8220399.1 hypothetical protein [Aeromonadaceae bacterium]